MRAVLIFLLSAISIDLICEVYFNVQRYEKMRLFRQYFNLLLRLFFKNILGNILQ